MYIYINLRKRQVRSVIIRDNRKPLQGPLIELMH